MRKTRFWPTSPPFPLKSPAIRTTSSLIGVLTFGTAVYESSRFSYFTFVCTYLYLSAYAFYDCTWVKAHMAASKLTHAIGNIFMEPSFNACLCSLGSTVTLASRTALSNAFSVSSQPTLCAKGQRCLAGHPPGAPRPLWVLLPPSPKQGWEQAALKLSPTTLHTRPPPAVISRTAAFFPCPTSTQQCPTDSSKPNLCEQLLSQCPDPERGGRRTTRQQSTTLQETWDTLLLQTFTPALNQDFRALATPGRELVATLSVTVSALVDSAAPANSSEKLLPSSSPSKGSDLLEVFAPMVCPAPAQLCRPPGRVPCVSLPAEPGNLLLVHPGGGRRQKLIILQD